MSPTPNRASNSAGGKTRSKNVTLDLSIARKMLPLVRGIVSDIVAIRGRLDQLMAEQRALDDVRRTLDWDRRQRRYAVADEISQAEQSMTAAVRELHALGVKITDRGVGRVDFPTKINGRPAAFAWRLGDDELTRWHYAGDDEIRTLPGDWQFGTPLRSRHDS